MAEIGRGLVAELVRRGGENALTELLAELLRAPALARAFLRRIADLDVDDGVRIAVETQVTDRETKARPDLVLTAGDAAVWVEAKLDAALTPNQPAGYLEALSGRPRGRLVFLIKAARWRPLSTAIRSRLGQGVVAGRTFVSRGVPVVLATWREVRQCLDGVELSDPVARFLRAELAAHIEDHVERSVVPLTPELLPMLTDIQALTAFAALEDLLAECVDELESRRHVVRHQEKGELRQHGFYVAPRGDADRELYVGIVARAGAAWPGRGALWAWLFGDAFDDAAQQRMRERGFEVLDPTGRLPDWEACPLVPLRIEGASPTDQVQRLADRIEALWS